MQLRIAERDRQTEARAADRAGARRVGSPEAVEHALDVLGLHAEPEVAHPERDSLLIAVDRDDDRPSLAVLDRVAEQVAHDPPHAARIHLDRRVAAGRDQADVGAVLLGELVHRADHVFGEVGEARRLEFELHRPGVVPADLEQVGQQRLEPLHLRVQQLGGSSRRRIELGR